MDIYFCDECGTRVTDLDLRAGKGMRKRHDTICPGCVDQGLAGSWLARAGQQGSSVALGGRSQSSAALAVAEAPDPIAIARDRARTLPDDPFSVDEPVAIKPLKPSGDTESIPAAPPKPAKTVTPMDGLAAAGGGFGALVGSSMPSPPPGLVDDPEDSSKGIDVADGALVAQSESPFDFVHPKDNDNPGKAETAEVVAVDKNDEPKGDEAKPARTASGRQQSQKRSSTATSKRSPAKTPSTRRSSSSRSKNNKVVLFSLASCAVMLIVFALVMLNRGGPPKPGVVIHDQPLTVLKDCIEKAKRDSGAAMGSDDIAVIERAIASVRTMQSEFRTFQSKAKNWDEDAHGEQLRIMGYYDVQSTLRDLNNRKVIVEQRGKP